MQKRIKYTFWKVKKSFNQMKLTLVSLKNILNLRIFQAFMVEKYLSWDI